MPTTTAFSLKRLTPEDRVRFADLMTVFGQAFDDEETYCGARPSEVYVARLLANQDFIALAAVEGDAVLGGLAAYVLRKFERERSEIYIYDLAVARAHRRRGIATTLIEWTRRYAAQLGASAVYLQADPPDLPAVALYDKLGRREEVLHFDFGAA